MHERSKFAKSPLITHRVKKKGWCWRFLNCILPNLGPPSCFIADNCVVQNTPSLIGNFIVLNGCLAEEECKWKDSGKERTPILQVAPFVFCSGELTIWFCAVLNVYDSCFRLLSRIGIFNKTISLTYLPDMPVLWEQQHQMVPMSAKIKNHSSLYLSHFLCKYLKSTAGKRGT